MTLAPNRDLEAGTKTRLADFAECLWKPFRGPRVLQRLLVGFVVGSVPLAGWCVFSGYVVRVIRQNLSGGPQPLPGWTEMRTLIRDGLRVFVLYSAFFAIMLPLYAAGPLILLGGTMLFPARALEFIIAGAILWLLLMLPAFALLLLIPSAVLHLAAGGLREAFGLGRQLRTLRRHRGTYFRILMFLGLVQIPAQILAQVPFLASTWSDLTPGSRPVFSLADLWPPSPIVLASIPLGFWGGLVGATALGLAGRRMGLARARDPAPNSSRLAPSESHP